MKSMSLAERLYKGTRISVVQGDITKLEVDAIVNPANSSLLMGGGVAGAILRAGGNRIQQEALREAPVSVGKAVSTTGGRLKAKYVIHAPTMTRPAMATNVENVRLATRAALERARQIGAKIVALPGMGTGVGGVNPQDAAKVMFEEVKNHVDRGTSITHVILVGYGDELTRAFSDAAADRLS